MKIKGSVLLTGLATLFLVLSAVGFVKESRADGMTLDQAQKGVNYGFWFDDTAVRWQAFKPKLSNLSRLDLNIQKNGKPGNMVVAVKDSSKNVLWETVVSAGLIPSSGWVEIAVSPSIPLTPEQTYYIYVSSDADSTSTEHRYSWLGQTNAGYTRGITSVEKSWPGYDFAFRTWGDTSEFARTCFIHSDDASDFTAAAESFKALLDANGCPTTLITMNQVAGADFSIYDLIIVASDTNSSSGWNDADAVNAVRNAEKPILGLGYGGASLFTQLNFSINWGNGWIGSENDMYVVDRKHPVFNSPNPITVPRTGIIEVYTSTGHIGEYRPGLADDVILLGREPQDDDHYTLVQEDEHLLWGYTASPADMKQTGKALFINVVHHAVPTPVVPLFLSLGIEDALEGVTVNKVAGDQAGPAGETTVEVVAKLFSLSSTAKNDIPVVLTIPNDLFGSPSHTWTRNTPGGSLTATGYDDLGGGQYRVTTGLSAVTLWPSGLPLYYRKQIVWRFNIPNDISPQDIQVTAEVEDMVCVDPSGSGTVRIMAPGSPRSLMIANRSLLYENYNEQQVNSLLQRLYTEAQGFPASHTPCGIIYYVDRHSTAAENWDNTNINYTSQATANVVADEIDDLIEDWHDDATKYTVISIPYWGKISVPVSSPSFLLMVGDDDTIPFYRYDDPSNDEGIDKIGWCPHGWCVDSAANPAILATDEDFFFTDNPYADLWGGSDWETGNLELHVGRLVGDTASDMLSLLAEGVDWDNGRTGGVVMASVDGWELGLESDDGRPGEIADLWDVPALFRAKGFDVRNDDIPASEVQTIDVMTGNAAWNTNFKNAANDAGGMDLFFIGGHDSYDHAVIYGDDFSPDDTPIDYTRFDDDHPIAMIVGCHGGLPVPDIDVPGGVDDCMVYDLVHEGARAYIGASGFSYGSPGNLHKCTWGERLMQRFFKNLLTPGGSNSMAIGGALSKAKRDYTFGYGSNDALDRKTVTEFNLFGVPWSFIYYPDAMAAADIADVSLEETVAPDFSVSAGAVAQDAQDATYTQTFEVKIETFDVEKEENGNIAYEVFSVKGGKVAAAAGLPILPYVEGYALPLPFNAKILDVKIVEEAHEDLGGYNVPIAVVQPWSEGGMTYTDKSDIDYPFPKYEALVQYQQSGNEAIFTLFPIQHNPRSKETFFYNYFTIQVTYEAPLVVTVTQFETDQSQYAPGETIRTSTRIENVGDVDQSLWARLSIKDYLGEDAGYHSSKEFVVPSGGSYDLSLLWGGTLEDGAYTARIALYNGNEEVGGDSEEISVVGGDITALSVQEVLGVGSTGLFEVTFTNFSDEYVKGEAHLKIQQGDGGYVRALPYESFDLGPGLSRTFTFDWTPINLGPGMFSATAEVVANERSYGPKSKSFSVVFDSCLGDLNGDGDIDGEDLAVFAADFGRKDCNEGEPCRGDFEPDGDVDEEDLSIFVLGFGGSACPVME